MLRGVRQDVLLDLALEQIIGGLHRLEGRSGAEAVHLRRTEITDPDRPDLSLTAKVIERPRRLLERHGFVGPMHLINVDDIGLQPAQRILELLPKLLRRGVAKNLAAAPVEPRLGGDHGLSAPAAGQSLADDFLGLAEAIDRRGVDHVDAAVERLVNRFDGLGLVAAAPHPSSDRPGAKGDAGSLVG